MARRTVCSPCSISTSNCCRIMRSRSHWFSLERWMAGLPSNSGASTGSSKCALTLGNHFVQPPCGLASTRAAPRKWQVITLALVFWIRNPVPSKSRCKLPVRLMRPSANRISLPPASRCAAIFFRLAAGSAPIRIMRSLLRTHSCSLLARAGNSEAANFQSGSTHRPTNSQSSQDK